MKPRIHIYLPALLLACLSADSQKISKTDKLLLANLQTHIRTLYADTASGRTVGTPGEKATADYIISGLSNAGLRPKGDDNGWLQTFTLDEGRQIGGDALLTVDDHSLVVGKEWFPLSICPVGDVKGSPAIALPESGVPWFQDLKEWTEAGSGNPHFDLMSEIRSRANACAKKGATALILYNSGSRSAEKPGFDPQDKLKFDPRDKSESAAIPVVYITRDAKQKYLKDESASTDIRIRVSYTSQHRTGHNVIGYLDNGAHQTIVIGSRYENTGGLAAMIELARLLAGSRMHGNNYLFVVFSAGRQSWPGSEYFVDHPAVDLHSVHFLVDLNLGDGEIRSDSSVTQPGDHTAFYQRHVPLIIFSGGHTSPDCAGEMKAVKTIYLAIEGADTPGSPGTKP